MHGIVKPERQSKEHGKSSIAESQLSTIKFIENDVQLDLYSGDSPFLLIKQNIFAVQEIFVIVDQIIYKMDTVAAALALCFKSYQVFNFNYNKKSLNFWLFIQKVLFDIHLSCDVSGSSLLNLTSFFETQN